MYKLFFTVLLIFPLICSAKLYKWVDENGEVVYSDQPPLNDAPELKLPPLQTTPAVKPKPKPVAKEEIKEPEKVGYTSFSISSPAHEETIRNSEGNITVSFAVNPALNIKAGDYINIKVNGNLFRTNISSTSAKLKHLNRGANDIQAELYDKTGKLLKSSDTVTVFVHRHSKLHNKPAP